MTRKVSVSKTGQDQPKPTTEERDAAFSKDGGRKAVEEPIEQHKGDQHAKPCCSHPQEPIGLQMETRGDEDE